MKEEREERAFYRVEVKLEDGRICIVLPSDALKTAYWFKFKKDAVKSLKKLKREEFSEHKLRIVKVLETSIPSEWI